MCAGLSVGLHGLLLGAATFAVLSGTPPGEIIRVSLLSGGGGGAVPAAPVEAAVPAPALRPREPAQPPRRPYAQRPHAHTATTARRTHVETQDVASLPATEPPASGPTDGGSGVSGAGAGSGQGSGGLGHGSGSGSGSGADQRAACVYCPQPRYPFIARARGWQGSVDVGLLVLADGTVDAASLRRSSGYGVLDEAAIAVARQSRFSPPAAQGLPTPLHGRIEYRFELSDAR